MNTPVFWDVLPPTYLMDDGGSTFLTNQHTYIRLHDVTSQKIVDTPQVLVNVPMNFQVL